LLRALQPLEGEPLASRVINHFVSDFRSRFLRLLQGPFRDQPTRLALSVVDPPQEVKSGASEDPAADGVTAETAPIESQLPLRAKSLLQFLSRDDLHRIEQYGRNLVEHALVMDIVPTLSMLFLSRRMPEVHLSPLQCAILVGVGCQHRTFDQMAGELGTSASQLLALFNKAVHKLSNHCRSLLEHEVEEEEDLAKDSGAAVKQITSGQVMTGGEFIKESLKETQQGAAKKVNAKLEAQRKELLESLSDEFAVVPNAGDMHAALGGNAPSGTVSVKRPQDGPVRKHPFNKKQRQR